MLRFRPFRRALQIGLAALTLVIAPVAVEAQTTPAQPALWVVRDADSTLYLFGTIHFLKPGVQWRTPAIERAFEASDRLLLEVADPQDQAAAGSLIAQYGLSPDRPLTALLTPEDRQRLIAAATTMGVAPARIDAMRPWLAGVMLSSAALSRAGYDPASGVDVALRAQAQAVSKTIGGLETPEDQIRMLSGFPEAGQIAFLNGAVRDFDAAPVELERLAQVWAAGDMDGVAAVTLAPMKARSALLYQALIVDRNQRWADQITTLLQGSGTTFVAVGALHLAGEDGAPALLARRGLDVTRIQ